MTLSAAKDVSHARCVDSHTSERASVSVMPNEVIVTRGSADRPLPRFVRCCCSAVTRPRSLRTCLSSSSLSTPFSPRSVIGGNTTYQRRRPDCLPPPPNSGALPLSTHTATQQNDHAVAAAACTCIYEPLQRDRPNLS
ncbi:hypothetical protein MRX96_000647 [Rhipicephalus microplus]